MNMKILKFAFNYSIIKKFELKINVIFPFLISELKSCFYKL